MSPGWIVTLILVVGIALVVVATVVDRRSELRASGKRPTLPAPTTEVDQTTPTEPPAYYSAEQLLDAAPPATRFSPDEERELATQLEQAEQIECRLATELLATHTGGRLIVDQPRVLACPDQIEQIREILRLLADASADRTPLVIAATAIDADTLQTLVANKLAGTVDVALLLGDQAAVTRLAEISGAPMIGLDDRRAGAAKLTELGHPSRLVADGDASWVIL